jgi:hypothetical protein
MTPFAQLAPSRAIRPANLLSEPKKSFIYNKIRPAVEPNEPNEPKDVKPPKAGSRIHQPLENNPSIGFVPSFPEDRPPPVPT